MSVIMTTIFTIWLLALAILVIILGFAALRARRAAASSRETFSQTFGEFLADQCHDVLHHVARGVHYAKPHVRYYSRVAMVYPKRGHDFFVERVFGRVETKKGISTSFFLKSIAEHKVETRADGSRG